jgi:hypothetical protein
MSLSDKLQHAEQLLVEKAVIHSSELLALYREANFTSLLNHVETELANDPNCVNAKFWWIRSHLALGDVPLIALSSPVEEVFSSVLSAPLEHDLAVVTLTELSRQLYLKKQLRMALINFSRVFELVSSTTSLGLHQDILTEIYRELLVQEIERATAQREGSAYIEELKSKLKNLTVIEKKPIAVAQVSKHPEILSAKSIVQKAEQMDVTSAPSLQSEALVEPSERKEHHLAYRVMLYGLAISLVLFGGYFISTSFRNNVGQTAVAIEKPEIGFMLPALAAGYPSDLRQLELPNLKTVSERLEKLNSAKLDSQSLETKSEDVDYAALARQEKASDVAPAENQPPTEATKQNAKIEPTLPQQQTKPPSFDTSKYSATAVESVESGSSRKVSVEELYRGPDGRIYSTVREAEEQRAIIENSRSLDGGPIKAYEVEQLPPETFFRILTNTDVLSSPSFVAHPVSRLEVGTKVEAVSRMGKWVEIVSLRGNKGYILAQDAEIIVNEPKR